MPTVQPDEMKELAELERDIAELTQNDPELRAAHQRIRSAFTIAEALSDVLGSSRMSVDEASERARVSKDVAMAALMAAPEVPATVDTVLAVADAAGFDFELQFIPEQATDSPRYNERETSSDPVPGGVLVKLPPARERQSTRKALLVGLQRFARRLPAGTELQRVTPLLVSDAVEVWKLVRLAEDYGFRLQFRFVRQKPQIAAAHVRTLSSGGLFSSEYRYHQGYSEESDSRPMRLFDRVFKTVES